MEECTIVTEDRANHYADETARSTLEDINSELGFCEKEGHRLQKKDITNWGYYKSQGEETSPSKSHVI